MASGGERAGRSANDKEKTKMRERQRRGITTKIFHGLRKHGGYHLSPRADINEVLRELAREAGWVVEPDGTTYRSSTHAFCPVCGAGKTNATPTPTSSIVVTAGCGGGECSTTTSPRRFPIGDSTPNVGGGPTSLYFTGGCSGGSTVNALSSQDLTSDRDTPLAFYMYGGLAGGLNPSAAVAAAGIPSAMTAAYQQHLYLQEARASNQNTPVGSPLRRAS